MASKNVIQAEGKAHQEDTGKADKNITPKPAEQKAKSKRKQKPEGKTSPFPTDA